MAIHWRHMCRAGLLSVRAETATTQVKRMKTELGSYARRALGKCCGHRQKLVRFVTSQPKAKIPKAKKRRANFLLQAAFSGIFADILAGIYVGILCEIVSAISS